MRVVQVERVDAEPPPAAGCLHGEDRLHGNDGEELRRDDKAGALRCRHRRERGPDDPLRVPGAVRFSGIDQRDPELHGAPQKRRGDPGGVRLAVAPPAGAELPRAKPDPGNEEALDLDVPHGSRV